MDTVFNDWKKALDDFKGSVEKDLKEIRKHKAEIVLLRQQLSDALTTGKFIRENDKLILSAPEIIIGNVDRNGDLLPDSSSQIIIRGVNINLEGGDPAGEIVSKAPVIRQIAVNPGIDGQEDVAEPISQIVSQARSIIIQANDEEESFSNNFSGISGGVNIHADTILSLNSSVEGETKQQRIEKECSDIDKRKNDVKKVIDTNKKVFESFLKEMNDALKKQQDLLATQDDARSNIDEVLELNETIGSLTSSIYSSFVNYSSSVSTLAELSRREKSFKKQKEKIKKNDDYKKQTTGSSISLTAERINIDSMDGEGNLRTNKGAGIFMNANSVSLASLNKDGKLNEEGEVSLTAMNLNLKTLEAKDLKFEKGKQKSGEYQAKGNVKVQSKNITLESLDYEVKEGELKEKALTADGRLNIRVRKGDISTFDSEGKSAGSVTVNSKKVELKSTDVDKENHSDKSLAQGSSLLLLSEKTFIGAKNKENEGKLVQISSDTIGSFAKTTYEVQQGEKKGVIQLDGGKVALSGDKTAIYGKTTIEAETEIKGALKAPKATIDSVEAKSAFKSPNISDGMSAGGGGGGGSLSPKLQKEEAPKEESK